MKRKKKRPQESTRSRHQPPGQIGQPANPQEKKKEIATEITLFPPQREEEWME